MLTTRDLTLQTMIVATASVDSTQIRGDGGLLAPALVIPLAIELRQRPNEERLALQRITAELWLPNTNVRLGPAVTVFGDSSGHGVVHSSASWAASTTFELRFSLTSEMVRLTEDAAHRLQAPNLELSLRIYPSFAHVRESMELDSAAGPLGQRHLLGQTFELWPFPGSGYEQLVLQISREHWAERIASGLGVDWLQVIALRLPKQVPGLDPKLVAVFDDAVAKYEQRDYRGAVQTCRDIRELVQASLGAQGAGAVASAVTADRGLTTEAPEHEFIDGAWELLVRITNTAHHSQSQGQYAAPDARAALLFTAVLLEYLADSLKRRLT